MIAVDHDPWAGGVGERRERGEVGDEAAGPEHQLTDQDEVVFARPGCGEEAGGKVVPGIGRNLGQDDLAAFDPAGELAARAVEFAVAGQHAQGPAARSARGCGGEADEKIMGIGREQHRIGKAASEFIGDVRLSLDPHFAHHPVPLAVGQPGGVFPAFDLTGEAGVGPEMMAVRGKVQPTRSRGEASGKQALEAHSWVRSAQSSGKARFVRVDSRYLTPAEPPVPILPPMIRSTVSICLCRQPESAASMSISFSANW